MLEVRNRRHRDDPQHLLVTLSNEGAARCLIRPQLQPPAYVGHLIVRITEFGQQRCYLRGVVRLSLTD